MGVKIILPVANAFIFVRMMPVETPMSLTRHAARVAGEAAGFIRDRFGFMSTRHAHEKTKNQLVSDVDMRAEDILVSGLEALLPGVGFLAEEGSGTPYDGVNGWIIDPLDGTTNFLYGLPHFGVSVGLQLDGRLVGGVVIDVMAGEEYIAWEGGGAWCDGNRLAVSGREKLDDSLLATGFPYADLRWSASYMAFLEEMMKQTRGLRRFGSAALDLAWTARGRYDAFFEYSLQPWDVAGGAVLVKEAGGVVTDFWGGTDFLHGETLVGGTSGVATLVQLEISSYFSRT